MLTKRELQAIKRQLPEDGYQKVSDKLENVTKESVRKVLNDPSRYNKDVIYASLQVIEEHKNEVEALKNKVREVCS